VTAPLRIRPLADAPRPDALLARAGAGGSPAALLSGPGAPELTRWSCFAPEPTGVTDDLEVAERFAERLGSGLGPDDLPFGLGETLPFLGGAIGYLTYDAGWRFAPRPRTPRRHPLGLPEARFALYDAVYLYDHEAKIGFVVDSGELAARRRADRLARLAAAAGSAPDPEPEGALDAPLVPGVTRDEHEARVERALELIADGEVYQVNLTYPLLGRYVGDPRAAFLRLARSAPPFSAYVGLGPGRAIVSGSPECFVTYRRADRVARTYPIKGTRPRGAEPREDARRGRELLASEKDRAEHLMIVDLLRNDLGRLAVAGGVEVEAAAYLESFPTVHHLTSRVRARIEPGLDSADVLRTLFPGGSITGAPKLRAMQIIDELEAAPRGVYTGTVVALSPLGMVASIAIRTAEIADESIRLGVGGGIVHDSDPAAEWQETEVKAQAVTNALRRGP